MLCTAHYARIPDTPLAKHRTLTCAKKAAAHSHLPHLSLPHKVIHGQENAYYRYKTEGEI
jgi:hypothetical protein